MPVKKKQLILMVILMIFGVTLALQLKSNLKINMQKPSAVFRIDDLKKQLEEEYAANEQLKKIIKENEKKQNEYLKSAVNDKGSSELNNKLEVLDNVKLKAGLTDVKGPGVVIKLDDAAAREGENPNVLIIHDIDIISVMNELKGAGAQAISINGERIVATSEQVCAGPTIRINKKRFAAPFIINAIGDAESIYEELNNSETIALMIKDRIRVDISKSDEIVVPKYILPKETAVQSNEE